MLADYLKGECWQTITDGVQLYKLPAGRFAPGFYELEPSAGASSRLDLFFCSGGSFLLDRRKNPPMQISEQEIFLLSDAADIRSVEITSPLAGYCVSIDLSVSRPLFQSVYRVLIHPDLADGRVEEMMTDHDGCIRIQNTSWNEATFSVLRSLPFQEQGHYCVLKIAELLYLLCAHHALLGGVSEEPPALGYFTHTIRSVRAYMEEHLDEKMTIAELSRQFHLSSTALKNGFRALYGQPVHAWLQNRRVQQAADLLQFSNQTVLQIAQAVGYEGVSQFNLVFKRQYGVTPSHYRKMSVSRTT